MAGVLQDHSSLRKRGAAVADGSLVANHTQVHNTFGLRIKVVIQYRQPIKLDTPRSSQRSPPGQLGQPTTQYPPHMPGAVGPFKSVTR